MMLLPPSLDELIEDNDMVRVVNRVVDSLETEEIREWFKGGGCPSYNPTMMLKVIIYAYSNKLYSSRQIAKALKRDVAYKWLSGMQRPEFATINGIKKPRPKAQ
ncbi:MAG: transposase [Deltaproteobacteria bacterium]|nr:transposase [Deltaproteobacteria bacterium]